MKKLIAILALSLSLLLCLTACGSKMPYDLSGTASVELHAYDNDSAEPFAKIVVDGEDVATLVEMFSSLKLKELDYTEPSIRGYEFWFKDADGNEIAKLSLPYGPSPWVVVGATAYQDVNGGVDVDYLAQLVDMTVSAGPANKDDFGFSFKMIEGSFVRGERVGLSIDLTNQMNESYVWTGAESNYRASVMLICKNGATEFTISPEPIPDTDDMSEHEVAAGESRSFDYYFNIPADAVSGVYDLECRFDSSKMVFSDVFVLE